MMNINSNIALKIFYVFCICENIWAEITEERRTEINDAIAGLLTKLDKTNPGFIMSHDTRPCAATLIAAKWLHYFKPEPEYFARNINDDGYKYEEMQAGLEKALDTMDSPNPTVVDNYANTILVFTNAIDKVKIIEQIDTSIVKATEEMLLQSYISRKKLSVKPGDKIEIEGDMFLKLKNPGLSEEDLEAKLKRTFTVPPLDTLTILKTI